MNEGYNTKVTEFSVITINLLVDLSQWGKRRILMVDQLAAINPDLIAVQEVSLKGNSSNAHWLAQELNSRKDEDDDLYNLYLLISRRRRSRLETL